MPQRTHLGESHAIRLAQLVCAEVAAWQPDFILTAAEPDAAWLPAATAAWIEQQSTPFPPLLRAAPPDAAAAAVAALLPQPLREQPAHGRLGRCLAGAYLDQRQQRHLLQQLDELFGRNWAPQRILVVVADEKIQAACTLLGYAHALFPQAELRVRRGLRRKQLAAKELIMAWAWLRGDVSWPEALACCEGSSRRTQATLRRLSAEGLLRQDDGDPQRFWLPPELGEPWLPQTAGRGMWDELRLFAHAICNQIEQQQPDLIVVLHRSAAVVWHAVETRWSATRTGSLPPAAGANIGREKAIFGSAPWFEPGYLYVEDVGKYIGIVQGKADWAAAFAAHIQAMVGVMQPRSILIIDDVTQFGDTYAIACALVSGLYPQAAIEFVAGMNSEWRSVPGWSWLDAYHPGLAARLRHNWKADQARFMPWNRDSDPGPIWVSLFSGLVSVENDPFATRPMKEEDFDWPFLLQYLPAHEWLTLPQWVRAETARQMQKPVPELVNRPARYCHYTLSESSRFYAATWRTPYFSLEDLAERTGCPPDEAAKRLQLLELETKLVDGVTYYTHTPHVGILDFEGLLAGTKLARHPWMTGARRVETPFAVEFAGVSLRRGGAPVLAAADGCGAPVGADLYVFHPALDEDDDIGMPFYRQMVLPEQEAAAAIIARGLAPGHAAIESKALDSFECLSCVYHAVQPPVLSFICDASLSREEKALRLAELALASLTAESYASGLDGISYLMTVCAHGVQTPLTQAYVAAVLELAGGVTSLAEARQAIARRAGWTADQTPGYA